MSDAHGFALKICLFSFWCSHTLRGWLDLGAQKTNQVLNPAMVSAIGGRFVAGLSGAWGPDFRCSPNL